MSLFTAAGIASQAQRRFVITGATGGLGFETALALAGARGEVILTGRNADKGRAALDAIRARAPKALIEYQHLDVASLDSVARFADSFLARYARLDVLVNNAGVMMLPTRQVTADGFEMQFGTNYLGHFALTARLLGALRKSEAPRVVELSSIAHRLGVIHFDDLQWERRYQPWPAYCQSKLAMLIFALELQRRSDAGGWGLMSNASHPGFARTDLVANGPGTDAWLQRVGSLVQPLVSQSASAGALPTLFAATAAQAQPGGYYGPSGPFELKGPVAPAKIADRAHNPATATRLWEVSQTLTHAVWPSA
jgi:NAD(P)-dependent dehydrogenase (short-subunit alcohol dehydrogenase family)